MFGSVQFGQSKFGAEIETVWQQVYVVQSKSNLVTYYAILLCSKLLHLLLSIQMDKLEKSKPKKDGKIAKKTLQVVLFKNKSPSKTKVAEKSEKAGPTSKKLTSPTLKKTPPLHSSTPKPVKKSTAGNLIFSASAFEKADHPYKQCFVSLEVLPGMEIASNKKKAKQQAVPKKQIQSKQKTKTERKIFPKEVSTPPLRKSTRKLTEETNSPRTSDTNITRIPSEVLENFGIIKRTPRASPPRQRYNTSVLSETPPRTSTACSSHDDVIEQTAASVSDESILPDSSENPQPVLRKKVVTPTVPSSTVIETDEIPTANVSSSNEFDPLETEIQNALSRAEPVANDLLYGFVNRLNSKPYICNLDELDFSNTDIRQVAVRIFHYSFL